MKLRDNVVLVSLNLFSQKSEREQILFGVRLDFSSPVMSP